MTDRMIVNQPSSKRSKTEAFTLPSSIIASFKNQDGVSSGTPVDVPIKSTAKQLEMLINSLLSNTDAVSQNNEATRSNTAYIYIYLTLPYPNKTLLYI